MNKNFMLLSILILMAILSINLVSAITWDNTGYYKMNEGSLTTVADIVNGVDGTLSGTWSTGIIEGSTNYTSSLSNYMFIPSTNYTNFENDSATISLWYYPNKAISATTLISKRQLASGSEPGFRILLDSSTSIKYGFSKGVSLTVPEFTANNWYHIVLRRSGTNATIWINGTNYGSTTDADNSTNNNQTYIGGNSGTGFSDARIDEVGFWNRSLTDVEIGELYNSGMGLTYSSASNYAVSLISPVNDSLVASTSINFTTNYNITGANPESYVWKNVTYYIWYSNGTLFNQTYKALSGNNTYNITLVNNFGLNNYKWNVKAYYGNTTYTGSSWADNNNTFSIGAVLTSLTYRGNTYETATENFVGQFTIVNNSQVSLAQLIYNNTAYTISNITQSGGNLTLSKSITLPLNSPSFSNLTNNFFFRFTYAGSVVQDSVAYQQNVSFINLQLCNTTYNINSLNFTLTDEKNLTAISSSAHPVTFETFFRYWLGDGTVYKNYSYQVINSTLTNNFSYCIHPYIPSNYTYKTNLDLVFSAQDYAENEYYLRNATLTNRTSDFSLLLYLLDSDYATKFYITVKQGIVFIDGALVNAAKFFVGEGEYKTTSIKITDSDGKFPIYAEVDSKYLFSVVKNGQVLGIVEKTLTCATAPCETEINLQESLFDPFSLYSDVYAANVLSNLSYNPTTKMVTYVFVDTSGLANYFRLNVQKMSFNGTVGDTICNEFSYSSAGTLNCNMTGYDGDFYAYGYISRSPEKLDKFMGFFLGEAIDELGLLGILLNIMIIVTMVLAIAGVTKGSPSAIVFVLGLTILLLKLGGLFPFSWAVVVPLELAIAFLLMKLKV